MASNLKAHLRLQDLNPDQVTIISTALNEFIKMEPEKVLHSIKDHNSPHQEKDLLSHTILSLDALYKTDRYNSSSQLVQFQLTLAVMLHDIGKACQWPNIDTSTNRWHFKGHDVVGACWFWNWVQRNKLDEVIMRPIFLAIWFHMVKHVDNPGLLNFLPLDSLNLTEILVCSDNYGRLEAQSILANQEILTVPNFPRTILPQLPLVLYICGKESDTNKNIMLNKLFNGVSHFSHGYISLESALLKITSPTKDPHTDIALHMINMEDHRIKSIYEQTLQTYKKDPLIQRQVQQQFEQDFVHSIQTNDVTIVVTPINKPSRSRLPFVEYPSIRLVTASALNGEDLRFFGDLRFSMSATNTEPGWISDESLLFLPEDTVISGLNHLLSSQTTPVNPPLTLSPSDLIPLVQYWIQVTNSIEYVRILFESFYQVRISKIVCPDGSIYYNLTYNDGAPYDDPFHPGHPSPASYCRGTTLKLSQDVWSIVRLPMNRGKEIAYNTDLCQDAQVSTQFYRQMIDQVTMSNNTVKATAKIDGTLLIVFKDQTELAIPSSLRNDSDLLFGTRNCLNMTENIAKNFILALKRHGHTVNYFAKLCTDYMTTNNLQSLSFEITGIKGDEHVVQYDETHQGLYFLGGSTNLNVYVPFFLLPSEMNSFVYTPQVTDSVIKESNELVLGLFPDHLEGSVIWVNSCNDSNQYYPLKLKTLLYYLFHKPNNFPKYHEYLIRLGETFGYIPSVKPIERSSLNPHKMVLSLFALVNLPKHIIQSILPLKQARETYDQFMTMSSNVRQMRNVLAPEEFQALCKFANTYAKGQYKNAYELF